MEENVTYPRTQKELVCIMEKAGKEGRLLETLLDEFAAHPFHMPALWACRSYLHQLDAEACRSHPALPPLLALLSAMEGDLEQAREYVTSTLLIRRFFRIIWIRFLRSAI